MKPTESHINLQYKVIMLLSSIFEAKRPRIVAKKGKKSDTFSRFFRNSLTCKQNFDRVYTGCTQGVGRVYTLCTQSIDRVLDFVKFTGATFLCLGQKNAQHLVKKMHFFRNCLIYGQNFDTLYRGCREGVYRVWTPCVQYIPFLLLLLF